MVRLIPRDERFFEMFNELADRLVTAARLVGQLFAEPARLEEHVRMIKEVEHQADSITHEIIDRIDRTFVTPFDREDIHALASRLDNVVDLLDGTARRAAMFHIQEVREPAKRLADVLIRASDCIRSAVGEMRRARGVGQRVRDVKLLEEEGDAIYHEAVGTLFRGSPDPLEVIKWKEMYDTLERAIDQCEDVANALESIALKHS